MGLIRYAIRMKHTLFLISGFFPLLGLLNTTPLTMPLIYSVFVLASTLGKERWRSFLSDGRMWVAVLRTAFIVMVITETLAWLESYFNGFAIATALFSTNYLENILIASGYYLGFALAWMIINRYFAFTAAEAFMTYGLFGILLEQNGAVLSQIIGALLGNPILAIFLGTMVLIIHGSIAGLMHIRLAPYFTGRHSGMVRYPVALVAIWIGVHICTIPFALLAEMIFD